MSEIAVLWFNKIQMKDPFFWTSPVGPRELPLQLPFPPWAQLVEEVAALRLHRANATLGGVQYGVQADGAARCLLPWRTRWVRLAVGGTWVGRAARVSLAGIDPLGMRGGLPMWHCQITVPSGEGMLWPDSLHPLRGGNPTQPQGKSIHRCWQMCCLYATMHLLVHIGGGHGGAVCIIAELQ